MLMNWFFFLDRKLTLQAYQTNAAVLRNIVFLEAEHTNFKLTDTTATTRRLLAYRCTYSSCRPNFTSEFALIEVFFAKLFRAQS